jgi:hypothetical protein
MSPGDMPGHPSSVHNRLHRSVTAQIHFGTLLVLPPRILYSKF